MNTSFKRITIATFGALFYLSASAAMAAAPPRNVKLTCGPLSYVFHCSVSQMANPALFTNCWIVEGRRSFLMDSDNRFNFYADNVRIHLNNRMSISAEITEISTGTRGRCVSEQ